MKIFKKNKFKENGLMGKKRGWVLNITIGFIFLIMFLTLITYPVLFVTTVICWILSNIIYGFYKKINENTSFRMLTLDEWNTLGERNLIHYSHILDNQIGNHKIYLPAHVSPVANFRLPKKFRKEGFIWFHLSDVNNEKEPELKSFLGAHAFEGNPRNQKVIIKLNSISHDRIYIEKNTNFILVKGDLNITGDIIENFEWYNKKIYLACIAKGSLKGIIILFYSVFIKFRAEFEEKKLKRKEEITTNM